jgi:hypothetical protein
MPVRYETAKSQAGILLSTATFKKLNLSVRRMANDGQRAKSVSGGAEAHFLRSSPMYEEDGTACCCSRPNVRSALQLVLPFRTVVGDQQ